MRPAPAGRPGHSLIEMLAVIGSLLIVLALGVAALHSLMRIERSARHEADEDRAITRLARQFRDDVRSARSRAEAGPAPGGGIALRRADGTTVEYRSEPEGIVVLRTEPGAAEPRHSRVRLRLHGPPRLSWVEQDGRAFARLELPRRNAAGRGDPMRIEAAPGRGVAAGGESP